MIIEDKVPILIGLWLAQLYDVDHSDQLIILYDFQFDA